jgi:two-component system chemotaxis sensor kinase CheA
VLDVAGSEQEALTVVVLQADDLRFAMSVAEVHDTQEIVVKPIGRQLKTISMYTGATVMGDGRVALILDVAGIARSQGIEAVAVQETEAPAVADERTSLLVLEVASGRRAALPLGEVSRLEEFPVGSIEQSGRHEVVQYRDGILPLVRLASAIGLRETLAKRSQLSVVVHEHGEHRVGIVIDRVLDIVETTVITSESGRRPGVLGSAVVQDRVTDLVDLDAVVALAGVAV